MLRNSGLWLICLTLVVSAQAFGSIDPLDLLQPGSPTDVLAAGLRLPGEFATIPDTSRPLSLLEYPSTVTLEYEASQPWRQTGANSRCLTGSRLGTTLLIRDVDRGNLSSFAASSAHADMDFREQGEEWTRAHTRAEYRQAGVAQRRGSWRVGAALGESTQQGSGRSTRLPEMAQGPGQLDWQHSSHGSIAELAKRQERRRWGLLVQWGDGVFSVRTRANRQPYSTRQEYSFARLAPYLAWDHGQSTDLVLLEGAWAKASGPVLVGNLEAGDLQASGLARSIALARRRRSEAGTVLYSIELSKTGGECSGAAGGFLFPMVFTPSYATDDQFGLSKLSLRYGRERARGATLLRYSLLVGYGIVDAQVYLSERKWMKPLQVLTYSKLDNAGLWFCSPAVGVGYRRGDWALDAGMSFLAGLLTKRPERLPAPPPEAPQPAKRSRYQPAMRFSVVLTRGLGN